MSAGPVPDPSDELLLDRLRQLSLVEPDTLLAGTTGQARLDLLASFADDLADALRRARDRMAELLAEIARGPDPLAMIDIDPMRRAQDGRAADAARRQADRLHARSSRCHDLARLANASAQLLPRLVALDHKRPG